MDTKSTSRVSRPVSAIRKIRKPIIEKKRRERINVSLEELKDMLLMGNAVHPKNRKPSKLEKADILEQTVQHVRELHQALRHGNTTPLAQNDSGSMEHAFRRGFVTCLNAIKSYGSDYKPAHANLSGDFSDQLVQRLEAQLTTLVDNVSLSPSDQCMSDSEQLQHALPPSPPLSFVASSSSSSDSTSSLLARIEPVHSGGETDAEAASVSASQFVAGLWTAGSETDSSCDTSCEEEDVLDLTRKESMWRPW